MLNVKEAVTKVEDYFKKLYPGTYEYLNLEEVELSEEEEYWYITLGFIRSETALETLVKSDARKQYKIFKISSNNGKLLSMKIGTLSA